MEFQKNVPLAKYSNFQIGGPAKYFYEAQTLEELTAATKEAKRLNEPVFILGGGCNLLINDTGFNGVVIKPGLRDLKLGENTTVTVGAGLLVSAFLDFCIEHTLSGWEWAGGLPGTMGGAIWGNAGAFGGETKDSIIEVVSLKLETGEVVKRTREECEFGYRTSGFKTRATNEIIVQATLRLMPGNHAAIYAGIDEKKVYRKERQPLEYPNVGSIFKNVPVQKLPANVHAEFEHKIKNDPFPVLPCAVLIGAAGLKEFRIGDAMVSPKHPNFIINMGKATSSDVKGVMARVQEVVKEKFGVELEPEVIVVG